jgi:Arginase family
MVKARDLDLIGVKGIIEKLKERVGDSRVYISVDIDVLDPAYAPGTLCLLFRPYRVYFLSMGCILEGNLPHSFPLSFFFPYLSLQSLGRLSWFG